MLEILEKINELQALELMIKNEQKITLELLKPSKKLENYTKLYNKLILDFFKDGTIKDKLTLDKCKNNISISLMIINYIQTLPLKINQDFVKEIIKTDKKLVKENYPNYYLLTDEVYLENLKNKLIHILDEKINKTL